MCLCRRCTGFIGMIVLVVGILFLLRDLGVWSFWGIEWWTALFLIGGLGMFFSSGCPECNADCCCVEEPKKETKKEVKKEKK